MHRRYWLYPALSVVVCAAWAAGCSDDTETTGAATTSTVSTGGSGPTSSNSSSATSVGGGGSGTGGVGGVGGNGGTGTVGGGGSGGMASTGGSGGTGGVMPPPNDTCGTATKQQVSIGSNVVINGTTIDAANDTESSCAPNDPDVVYEVDVTQAGTLTISVNDGTDAHPFDSAISFRKTQCDTRGVDDLCLNAAPSGSGETLGVDAPVGTYWVVVEGENKTMGDFALTLSLAAAKCGDGVVNTAEGEQCEPSMPNDPVCYGPNDPMPCTFKPPPPVAQATCPGQPEAINAGDNLVLGPFNNALDGDDAIGSCISMNKGGADDVFQITPSASGTLTLTVGLDPTTNPPDQEYCTENGSTCLMDGMNCSMGCWQTALYVRTSCADAASEVACDFGENSSNDTSLVSTVSVPVTAGTPYFVYVDGIAPPGQFNSGPYYLYASLK